MGNKDTRNKAAKEGKRDVTDIQRNLGTDHAANDGVSLRRKPPRIVELLQGSLELTKCINHRVPMEEGCTVPPFPMEDYVCVYIFNQQGSRDVGRAIGLLFFSLTT